MTPTRSILGPVVLVLLSVVSATVPDLVAFAFRDDPECRRWKKAFLDMPTRALMIESSGGRRISITVKVAATDEARRAGFQCATEDEIRTTVILFDFGREVLGGFHMQNVPAALDIAFAKESGRIFSILRMDPSPTARYGPMGAYRYAIEARAGFFKENGVSVGDNVLTAESR